jgi:hypothetical protein
MVAEARPMTLLERAPALDALATALAEAAAGEGRVALVYGEADIGKRLMGQLFHSNTSPNRYGIPAFYALHVWAWRDNPHGVFVDWNPRVSSAGAATR